MIITLAGHVDHGKTSLVRALTGVDTDRLDEEKRRGLTIDLGFAYLREQGAVLGFVDVPGHHRFIHNMVAGVSSEQHALLVIAADDGPMPQSREHLQILDLIGIESGTVALTKCDRVSEDRRRAALDDVRRLIDGSCLAGATIVETSTATGEGVDTLKSHLLAVAASHSAVDREDTFRMPIDRSFAISGAGVVVTGTVHAGRVSVDDALVLFPTMTTVRVKSIRAQNEPADTARTGERTALNLAGVDVGDVRRGQWLTSVSDPGSSTFTVRLRVLPDFPRALKHWLPVHVYHATSHSVGHIALLDEQRPGPGDEALVELLTAEPLLVKRGDRLVLRDQGLERTLGGGTVVSVRTVPGRRRSEDRVAQLAADALADPEASLSAHLALGPVDLDAFQRNWHLDDAALAQLISAADCLAVAGHGVRRETWAEWQRALLDEITRRHAADASLQGLKQSEIASAAPEPFVPVLLAELATDGKLVSEAGRFRPAAHKVQLADAERRWLDRIEPLLDQAQPPSLGDMAKQFRMGVVDLGKRLHPLVAKKYLVRVSDTRYFLPGQLQALADIARELAAEGPFTVRQYRDAAAIGRNVAIEVLEHFDRVGFTRRDGDTRRVVGELPG